MKCHSVGHDNKEDLFYWVSLISQNSCFENLQCTNDDDDDDDDNNNNNNNNVN